MSEVCRELASRGRPATRSTIARGNTAWRAQGNRSRRPVRYANQLPAPIEAMIVAFKQEK